MSLESLDDLLIQYNQEGFVPGPFEEEKDFFYRVESTKQAYFKLGVQGIPESHWKWSHEHLRRLFDFVPVSLPAFYSNNSLMPWQAAVAWVERDQLLAIQLRKAFEKGSFLYYYKREEILAHEAVHAVRCAFPQNRFDEIFAYMTSSREWIKVLGPIIQSPWEVWPFVISCVIGSFFLPAFLFTALWLSCGFIRLFKAHVILRKASQELKKMTYSDQKIRSIFLRLTEDEIIKISQGVSLMELFEKSKESLRWKMIYIAYLKS